jgi:hypothetical protein
METVSIHKAKAQLSRLVEKACKGEDIVIPRLQAGRSPGCDLAGCGKKDDVTEFLLAPRFQREL